ncbi:MAG TPA: TolC family protein [Myxococcales bacterium]|nr:TolC family protein [Myxococcales bacterium]
MASPGAALAVQPLDAFLQGAQKANVDALEAQAVVLQQQANKDLSLGRVLPGVQARGTYTRNQYDVSFPSPETNPDGSPKLGPDGKQIIDNITVSPISQFDITATLTVPLIDLAGFQRVAAAKTAISSADKSLQNTRLLVEGTVAQGYYQLVANLALVTSAQKALDVSRESLRLAVAREEAGTGPQLDVDRARADVESQTQQVASAQLQVVLSARALETASGIAPETTPLAGFNTTLDEEQPLNTFQANIENLPSLLAAKETTRSNEQLYDAQKLAFLPTLNATFSDHGTSVVGLTATHAFQWQLIVALNWQLDFTTFANLHLQDATTQVARVREQRARLAAGDNIHREWATVQAGIVRSKSARAGQEAAAHAASQAHDRYEAGTITQLDLLQAQRDAFTADVTRIQADADLVNARAQLKLASGTSLLATSQGAQAHQGE